MKDLPSAYILPLAVSHGISFSKESSMQNVKVLLQEHFDEGMCTVNTSSGMITSNMEDCQQFDGVHDKWMDGYLLSIENVIKRMSHKNCLRLITCHELEGNTQTLHECRRVITDHIQTLQKEKCLAEYVRTRREQESAERLECIISYNRELEVVWSEWLFILTEKSKESLIAAFMEETGSEKLKPATCASCAAHYYLKHMCVVLYDKYNLDHICVLYASDRGLCWPRTDIPLPFQDNLLKDLQLDPQGIEYSNSDCTINMCKDCFI